MNGKKFLVGLDIGGTKTLAAVVDSKNRIVSSLKARTPADKGEEYFLSAAAELVKNAAAEADVSLSQIAAVGVGCPGLVRVEDNSVIVCANMPFLNGCQLGKKLSRKLRARVVVENDVNMGLYGEFHFGAAKGAKNAAGFFLGTGIGGALILNGSLYRGSTGGAGELGHLFIDPLGPACGCGNRGCLEALCGRIAIAAEAAAFAAKGHARGLLSKAGTDIRNIKSGALAKAAATDKSIKDLIRFKAELLGIAMGTVVNVLNPELIVLGGGVVEAMPALFVTEAGKSMKKHSMPVLSANVKVVSAKLGDFAVALGSAKMARDRSR